MAAARFYTAASLGGTQFSAASGEYIVVASPLGSTQVFFKATLGSGFDPDYWALHTTVNKATSLLAVLAADQTVKIVAGIGPVSIGVGATAVEAHQICAQVHNGQTIGARYTPDPATATGSFTATALQLMSGVVINEATSTNTITLPTGTNLIAAYPYLSTGDSIDFSAHQYGTSGAVSTIAVNTDVIDKTGGGESLTILGGRSAVFRLRKDTSTTYNLYRISG